MKRRTRSAYTLIFKTLDREWTLLAEPRFKRIHTDYEKAEQAACTEVFGQERIYGCIFHYVHAVMLHLRNAYPALFKLCKDSPSVKKWIRRIVALPLLRRGKIISTLDM